jgi:hypothetical protein
MYIQFSLSVLEPARLLISVFLTSFVQRGHELGAGMQVRIVQPVVILAAARCLKRSCFVDSHVQLRAIFRKAYIWDQQLRAILLIYCRRILRKLSKSPHILDYCGLYESQKHYMLVTEFMDGGELLDVLIRRIDKGKAQYTEAEVALIILQVCHNCSRCLFTCLGLCHQHASKDIK